MVIEYSIGELKEYYGGRNECATVFEYTQGDLENIRLLEDRLSNMIDEEYTQNSIIYHIFPPIVLIAVSTLLFGIFMG
jgi:hypothetical protein